MPSGLLRDPDRRRAFAASLLVHALMLWGLIVWIDFDRPDAEPPESFLVIDLGEPVPAETAAEANANDAPAAPADVPSVPAESVGRPQPTPAPESETAVVPDAPVAPPPEPAATEADATEVQPPDTPPPAAPQVTAPAPPEVTPSVNASVPELDSQPLEPFPDVTTVPVPQPSVEPASATRDVTTVVPAVEAPTASVVPVPDVTVDAGETVTLNTPLVNPTVGAVPLAITPQVDASQAAADLPVPSVLTGDANVRTDLAVQPSLAPPTTRSLALPQVVVTVRQAATADGAGSNAGIASAAPVGGDAVSPGQPDGPPDAAEDALGLAAEPDVDGAGGTVLTSPPPPLNEVVPRPLAVIIDNVGPTPTFGLEAARTIFELPVEGGQTRLMAMFDRNDPDVVGPVRSARTYFVELAQRLRGVLVHVGGSTESLTAIAEGNVPTIDALTSGAVFRTDEQFQRGYNTFSDGTTLRRELNARGYAERVRLTGLRPTPPRETLASASGVTVDWSGAYDSGFRYDAEEDVYAWQRYGAPASTLRGEPVTVDAVLVARTAVVPRPEDPDGKVFVSLTGGSGTLFWQGRALEGRWSLDGGVAFELADGTRISLDAFRTWVALAPDYVEVGISTSE